MAQELASGRPTAHATRRDQFARTLLLCTLWPAVLLVVPLTIPLFTGRVFAYDDLSSFHLPLRLLYSHALGEGHSVLWTSALFGGFYYHAEGQVGALHPLHLMLYRLIPLATAFNIELILSYVFAFAGMWLFLFRRGVQPAAAMLGAMAFAFSGFNLLHLSHLNAIAVIAHIPWTLAAIDELLMSARPRTRGAAFAALAMLTGSEVLLGYPQYVWFSALISGVYCVTRARDLTSSRRLLAVAIASTFGVLIGAAQLLPTIELLSHSVRATVSREFQLTFSLNPLNLLQLVAPYVFPYRVYAKPEELIVHEFGVYNGALCTLATVWYIARRKQLPAPRLGTFAAALSIAGVVLAVGRYGLVYDALTSIPVIGSFRAASRYVLLMHLGLSILLALMFDDLARLAAEKSGPRPRLAHVAAAAGLSVVVALLAWSGLLDPLVGRTASSGALALGAGLLVGAAILVTLAARGAEMALLLIPMFMAADLALWGYPYVWSSPARTIPEIAARADSPPTVVPGTTVHVPTTDRRRNLLLLQELRLFRPYVALTPTKMLGENDPAALRLGGVEWMRPDQEWHRVPSPMPRARLVFDTRTSSDAASVLPTLDIARTAVVGAPAPSLDPDGRGTVRIVSDRPGRMEIDVSVSGRGLLATTESYYPGWTAAGGGRNLETVPLYGDYLGVVLEPGEYRVEVEFAPVSARRGVLLSLSGLVITFAGAAVLWRTTRALLPL